MLKIEEETTMLEDLDFEIVCRRKSCGKAAEWMGVGDCCGHTLYHCDSHRNDFLHNMTLAIVIGVDWVHTSCGKPTKHVEWTRIN